MDKINNLKLPFVAIQLTTRCNLDCKFCFRRNNFEEVDEQKMESVLNKISQLNPEKVVLSGGEPLLREDLGNILRTLKSNGIKTVLQSNGILLEDKLPIIDKDVDWYSLSLDGDSEESNSIMRGPGQFKKTINSLNAIVKLGKPVKVGTVVTKINKENILGIGALLKNKATVWKLYQFYARSGCEAEKNNKIFDIDNESFYKLVNLVKETYPELNISVHSVEDFSKGPCVLIHPDGAVHITKGKKDILIGNLNQEDAKSIREKIISEPTFESIWENYKKTYQEDIEK